MNYEIDSIAALETPHKVYPRSMGKTMVGFPDIDILAQAAFKEEAARSIGRRLGKYPNVFQVIVRKSKPGQSISIEAIPDNEDEIVDIPNDWVGYIRVNGVDIPIAEVRDQAQMVGNSWADALESIEEWEACEGKFTDAPILDGYNALRPGYKGGNVHNWMKDSNLCANVNYDKVAKRRAKNKLARKKRR